MEEQASQIDPVAPVEQKAPSHTALYLVVVGILCFVVGYGAAWFTFDSTLNAQNSKLETTVRNAVADAINGLNLPGDTAAAAEADTPQVVDVSLDDDPVLGPADAPITIVEFSDFRCGFCRRFQEQTYRPLLAEYEGQIKFVYRDFPVVGGERAAEAAECADDQGVFWEYHDILFANQSALTDDAAFIDLARGLDIDIDAFSACLTNNTYTDEVRADFEAGLSYGVRGTPAFFINGHPVVGAQPLAAFEQVINEILAEQTPG